MRRSIPVVTARKSPCPVRAGPPLIFPPAETTAMCITSAIPGWKRCFRADRWSGCDCTRKDLTLFDWGDFKKARIRHWLATWDSTYSHYDTLSVEQAPSPDGTTEGALVWYDYAGKPSGLNGERGIQIMPSIIARVMPDGTTWYQYI